MNKYEYLNTLITDSETLIVPDAYDGISAKIIEYCGFKAVQCSGYSYSISKKLQDEKMLTLDQNLSKTKEIVEAVQIPVMADGEDGYGYRDIFKHNILKFIHTGIAGINIEDQNLWNPYHADKIVSVAIMEEKINDIITIKHDHNLPSFIVNARTDALTTNKDDRKMALKIAIERGNTYLELGADMCFVTNVQTKEEVQLLKKEIHGPISITAGLPYNIDKFNVQDCIEIGVARVSLPSLLIYGALESMITILHSIKESGSFEEVIQHKKLLDANVLQRLLT